MSEIKTLSDNTVITLTVGDLQRLLTMTDELEAPIGRDVVHGDLNGDGYNDQVANVLSDVRCCLVRRWIASVAPAFGEGALEPDESRFDDDENWEETYEMYGFAHDEPSQSDKQ